MYGWADKHVFAKSQTTLDAVRVVSPADVIRPKPFCDVVLLEFDVGDLSLADANVARGLACSAASG
jgi:hypothetical protein